MNESERLERMLHKGYLEPDEASECDEKLASRIRFLLNDPAIDKYCMVDAFYYDFSVIPRGIQESLQLWRDCYLIYGITTEGEMITKWVDRWDLDSDDPIVDGKVIRTEKKPKNFAVPDILQHFDPHLLLVPNPTLIRNLCEDK